MSPQKKDNSASGSAIAAGGATTAGAGVLGGGIPGTRPDASKLGEWRSSGSAQGGRARRAASTARAKAPAAKAAGGGVFGYRASAHKKFATEAKANNAAHAGTTTSRVNMYHRGEYAGKIPPEDVIIRHMRRGRGVATAALVGGAAATNYGVRRTQGKDWRGKVQKSQRDTDKLHGALLGGGAATAAGSIGGARLMESQGRKWSGRAASSLGEAQKIVPNMGGHVVNPDPRRVQNPRVPDIAPAKNSSKVVNDKKILAGKSKLQVEAAAQHRGAAKQQRYFAGVYGKTAMTARKLRNPALATAGVGAAGMALSRKKDVKKSHDPRMSAFGVEH